jgi:hypothetical protein
MNKFAALFLLFLAGVASPLRAQETIVIVRDGALSVNGSIIPVGEMPDGIDLRGVSFVLSVSGDARPIVDLGRKLYTVEDGKLVPFIPGERRAFHLRRDDDASFPGLSWRAAESAQHVFFLNQRAAELERVAEEIRVVDAREMRPRADHIARIVTRANEVAQVARELPDMEIRHYMVRMREQDGALYERLVREQQMEFETLEMARRVWHIGRTPTPSAEAERLTSRLVEIFELKQENRRYEIQTLERQLQELRERLLERERQRDVIIEQRFRQLVEAAESR